MKKALFYLTCLSAILLAACSKHPSSMVGEWETETDGMFSVSQKMRLDEDGSCRIKVGSGLLSAADSGTWEFSNDTLTISDKSGDSTEIEVVSNSDGKLILNTGRGKVTYRKKDN